MSAGICTCADVGIAHGPADTSIRNLGVGKLLADGGVDQLMAEFEPKLAEMKAQLPRISG